MPPRAAFCGLSWDERQISLFARCGSIDAFESFAKRIKMDSKTRDTGISVLKNVPCLAKEKNTDPRTFLIGKSDEVSLKCAKVAASLGICSDATYSEIAELIVEDAPRKISQLKINGNDLIAAGIRGEKIGEYLSGILNLVARGKLGNERDELIKYIANIK